MRSYYAALADLARLAACRSPLEQLAQDACEHVASHTGAAVVYIVLIDHKAGEARVVAAAGDSRDFIEDRPMSLAADEPGGMGLAAQTYRARATLVFNDLSTRPEFSENKGQFERLGLAAAAGIPLITSRGCRAVLGLVSKQRSHFSPDLVSLAERMGDILASTIEYADEREVSNQYTAFYAGLASLNDLVARESDPAIIFEETCRIITKLSPHLASAIVARKRDGGDYWLQAWSPNLVAQGDRQGLGQIKCPTEQDRLAGHGLVGKVLKSRSSVHWDANAIAGSGRDGMKMLWRAGARSLLGVPILAGGGCEGVFLLSTTRPFYFTEEIQHLAGRIAGNLGQAILSRRQRSILEHQAMTDSLTGIPNRTLLMDRLNMAITQAGRNKKRIALAVIDIDGLKDINDQFGHAAGDEAICLLARKMTDKLRGADTVARLGGDEFAAVFDLDGADGALDAIAQHLMEAVTGTVKIEAETVRISASIGFSLYPEDGLSAEDLLRRADLAMYRGKRQGGNSWHLFEAEAEEVLINRHRLKSGFEHALAKEQIVFHYQPKVDMRTGEVFGAEALARWIDPQKGMLLPNHWVPVIETNAALSSMLGRYALACVMDQLIDWHAKGLKLLISLNVGARHLQMPWFVDDVSEALKRAPQLAPYLGLEVTETALVDDFERLRETLKACRNMGIRIALDDFGTGYASLAYLQNLPADVIKIDLEFIQKMPVDVRAFSIVAGTLQISQMSALDVVAEGVETEEHGRRLLQLGCHYAQGYAISLPLPADEFESWLKTWKMPASWQHEPGALIAPRRLQLLGSLVYHRYCHTLLSDDSKPIAEREEVLKDRCPIMRSSILFSELEAGGRLQAVHRILHQLEELALNALMRGEPLSKAEEQRRRECLREYEKLIDRALMNYGDLLR